jgi:D-alanine-D-alanine ligase
MKEWWRNFFTPITGEIMFSTRVQLSKPEVEQILKKTRISEGSDILDLACGIGRHSFLFAKKGYQVIGLDFSKNFLHQAKVECKRLKSNVEFIHGDMKNLKPHFSSNRFDMVVSLYNSFGYFDKRSDDIRMLKETFRVLRPGGKLVINTLNGACIGDRIKVPVSLGREPVPGVFMIDAVSFDKKQKRTLSKWTLIDTRKGKAKIFRGEFQQNVYTHSELCKLLKSAGFRIETVWGLLHGGKFIEKKTWHQTIVAVKPLES